VGGQRPELSVLIEHYELEVFTPPTATGRETFSAIARLSLDIAAVLPYLNAALPGAIYQRAANVLLWKQGALQVTLYAHQIAIGNVGDYDQIETEIEALVALINRTWEQRAELTPDYATQQRPPLMAVYKLLPQTNCMQCGEPTCYAFAIKLAASQKKLAECAPLTELQHAEKRAALQNLVGEV
jgi:ArsR family metal-binding transcriptional regulator